MFNPSATRLAGVILIATGLLLLARLALRPAAAQSPERPRPVSAWGLLPATRTVELNSQGVSAGTFYATDFQTFACFPVQAALEYTGTHSFIYLDTTQSWARSLVTPTAQAFDAMWPVLVSSFGPPPDRDGDPRFSLLLLDIRDPYYHDPGATSYIPAYFDPLNEAPGPCSSSRELIYVDLNPTSPGGLDGKRGLAHSLVNAILWQADPTEELWLAESLAYLGEYIAGLGHRPEIANFLANPRNPLTGHTHSSGDAGQEYLWALYLSQQYGPTAVYSLTQSSLHGLASVEAVTGADPADLFHRWTLANMADAGGGATPYGYAGLEIVAGAGDNMTTFKRPPATSIIVPPPDGWPGSPPYRRPPGLDLSGSFQGVGYYAADYYRLYPLGVPTWIVDVSDERPFGQSVYSDAVTAAANWANIITIPTVITGSSFTLACGPGRTTGALGQYRYQLWPLFPPWWPGWAEDGSDDEDGDCLPDWVECPEETCPDSDADGRPDYRDDDSDNDGLQDHCEAGSSGCPLSGPARDSDADGIPDYRDNDDDNDGVPTFREIAAGQSCATAGDCDRDGLPDYLDDDSDDDGILDGSDPSLECATEECETCLYLPLMNR